MPVADFNEGMLDYLQTALKAAVDEVNRLRRINEQLLSDLNAVPVEMWELQERVTCLELQLASAKDAALDVSHSAK